MEETTANEKLPEEFVADSVIRFRATLTNGYTRRTLEIEKSRGQPLTARGQHPFDIESASKKRQSKGRKDEPAGPEQDKIIVYPSLHFRGELLRPSLIPSTQQPAKFGIPHLDTMLYSRDGKNYGLLGGQPFALVGEPGTSKTLLAQAFLAQALTGGPGTPDPLNENSGVAIFLSSRAIEPDHLLISFANLIAPPDSAEAAARRENKLRKLDRERIILETLAVQDLPAAKLVHRVEKLIDRAEEALVKLGCRGELHRIRFAFDDMTALRNAYPEVSSDPLFLPLLIRFLKVRRVSSLIVASQSGRPDSQPTDSFDAEMRFLFDGYLVTWRVPFLGEMRTAVTFVSGFTKDRRSPIREVVPVPISGREGDPAVKVTRDFEMYVGLEKDAPEPVPLEVRLYAETGAFATYIEQENKLFCQLFPGSGGSEVITALKREEYDSLRDYCYLSASTRLPKTLILQVDEFWHPARTTTMLTDLRAHLDASLTHEEDEDEDHYEVFRRSSAGEIISKGEPRIDQYAETVTRKDQFPLFRGRDWFNAPTVDRMPFSWDFGFMLLTHDPWHSALKQPLPLLKAETGVPITVATVLDALKKPPESVDQVSISSKTRSALKKASSDGRLIRGPQSWRALVEACVEVSKARMPNTILFPFDLTRPAGESFSCLVLEIWLSEILEQYGALIRQTKNADAANVLRGQASAFMDNLSKGNLSLRDLLKQYPRELFMVWMLLSESIDFESLVDRENRFGFAAKSEAGLAAASRHWYKTACEQQAQDYPRAPTLPCRLPGYFSTRGDWFLAMADGSRSHRLGTRALDILSSRRANIARLQQGIGLPVRDIAHPAGADRFRTRLSYIGDNRRRATLGYAEMIGLGADETIEYFSNFRGLWRSPTEVFKKRSEPELPGHVKFAYPEAPDRGFFWLWRSQISNYDRESRMWQKWLVRTALVVQAIKVNEADKWINGLTVYDRIAKHTLGLGAVELPDSDWKAGKYGIPHDFHDLETYRAFVKLVPFVYHEFEWHDCRNRAEKETKR